MKLHKWCYGATRRRRPAIDHFSSDDLLQFAGWEMCEFNTPVLQREPAQGGLLETGTPTLTETGLVAGWMWAGKGKNLPAE